MALNRGPRPNKMKALPYIGWAAITFAVFGWHTLWWGALSPEPLPDKIASTASTIRYLPIEPDNDDPRLKEILAPLIFSTPSLAGFSQPLLEKGAESVPPLRVVEDLSVVFPFTYFSSSHTVCFYWIGLHNPITYIQVVDMLLGNMVST